MKQGYHLMLRVGKQYYPVNFRALRQGDSVFKQPTIFTNDDIVEANSEMVNYSLGDFYWKKI